MQEKPKRSNHKTFILNILSLFFIILYAIPSVAATDGKTEEENDTKFIMHHIADAHEWHFVTIGHTHITLPLPIILYSPDRGLEVFSSSHFYEGHEKTEYKGYAINDHEHIMPVDESRTVYDFSITKNVASLFLSLAILLIIFLGIATRYKKHPKVAPTGLQSLFEPIVIFIRDDIAIPNIGKRKYERFMPYLLTLFFFIWFNNIFGLIPGAANLTGNIAVTFVLAIITFIITNVNGNKAYWKHIFATPGVPWAILPLLVLVEFIGLFTKPFSLMIRLFVSITAGHIVILSLIALGFIFESYVVGVGSALFVGLINIIELLVATIQAYVFTLFSSIYIGGAVAEHHPGEVDKSLV